MSLLRARLVLRMVLNVSLFGLTVSGVFHVVARSLLLADVEHELESEITFVAGLTIENVAPALSADDLERAFDPFWRQSRVSSTDVDGDDPAHFGLGLALAKDAAERAGLELTAELNDSRICFRLSASTLPGAASSSSITASGSVTPEADNP